MKLAAISREQAKAFFLAKSAYRGDFDFAIAATDEKGETHGVIAIRADGGDTAVLGHIHTDGSAQVGSLLYGAAWRAAKALGYELIRI